MTSSVKPLAIGLLYRPSRVPRADRFWARALIIRHAREIRARLIEIYELDDDGRRNGEVLARLVDLAAASRARVLVTDGVPPALATRLAADLGLAHEATAGRPRTRTDA
jgi:hypothetical protein